MASASPSTPLAPALGRLFWTLAGPMTLVVLGLAIIRTGEGWFTLADLAFLVVLAALPLARWIEFQGGDARTASGEPARREQFVPYAATAVGLGLLAWVVVNLLANYMLVG